MKILLVNNNTKHLDKFKPALPGHHIEIQKYEPGIDFHYQDKDLVILSGGRGMEMHDEYTPGKLWYEDEMNFVLSCNKPILGICMGFEVIAAAYGSQVEETFDPIYEEFVSINTTTAARQKLTNKKTLTQFSAHHWGVKKVSQKEFEILADSNTGIEIIKHKNRPLFATQFHPELPGGSLELKRILTPNIF